MNTDVPLDANEVYRPSESIDTWTNGTSRLHVLCSSDQPGWLAIEQSEDEKTWICAIGPAPYSPSPDFDGNPVASIIDALVVLRYVRPVYMNADAAQTRFVLITNEVP